MVVSQDKIGFGVRESSRVPIDRFDDHEEIDPAKGAMSERGEQQGYVES